MLGLQDAEFARRCGKARLDNTLRVPRASDTEILLESYGVLVRIQASDSDLLSEAEKTARRALVGKVQIFENGKPDHIFEISSNDDGTLFLRQNGEQLSSDSSTERFFKFFNSMLRIAVAEYARDSVFIHAGVVGWQGKAVVIPANSFAGKTTLVAELVRNGAVYYSDEYAVLDENGLVHPFPRDLSVRNEMFHERDVPVTELGGTVGVEPLPVGAVLITEFREGSTWEPVKLTAGQGMLEVIPHTIPRNFNTKFSLKVLNTALSDAIILKCPRGEASDFVLNFLSYIDDFTNVAKIN